MFERYLKLLTLVLLSNLAVAAEKLGEETPLIQASPNQVKMVVRVMATVTSSGGEKEPGADQYQAALLYLQSKGLTTAFRAI